MALILLRHTRPEGAEGICYGRHELDIATDFAAAAAAVEAGLPPVTVVVTSPALRCRRLADFIGAKRDIALEEDRRLAEMDFGSWEGQRWASIPLEDLDRWNADFLQGRPHGGESVEMLLERVGSALHHWRRSDETVLLVSHAGVARAARALIGLPEPFTSRLDYGEWIRL